MSRVPLWILEVTEKELNFALALIKKNKASFVIPGISFYLAVVQEQKQTVLGFM